jgi:hypothetical protein
MIPAIIGFTNQPARTYNWLHLPTNTTGQSRFEKSFLSDSQAIRLINEWNVKQPHVWIYWV